jgi:hypothetical protein
LRLDRATQHSAGIRAKPARHIDGQHWHTEPVDGCDQLRRSASYRPLQTDTEQAIDHQTPLFLLKVIQWNVIQHLAARIQPVAISRGRIRR